MDEILQKKPNDRLENADPLIKTYIRELENKLRTTLLLESHDKKMESQCLELQQEIFSINMQNEENDQMQKKQMQQLKLENDRLELEIKVLHDKLKQFDSKQGGVGVGDQLLLGNVSSSSSSSITGKRPVNNRNKSLNQIDKNNGEIDQDQADANSVLVKGITQNQLNKTSIIRLASDMKLSISATDIVKVSPMERKYYERHNLQPDKMMLIVVFQTLELKVEFLKNKDKLKLQSSTKEIEIIDYVSDEAYHLYQYAKILKSVGYVSIYWRNNCIYAKKTRSSLCEPILIKSKNEVDILKVLK